MAAVECRSETGTVLTTATFDSKQMNWAMLGEFVLAVLVTQMDVFNRLLGTVQLNLREFGWALLPADRPAAAVGTRQVHRATPDQLIVPRLPHRPGAAGSSWTGTWRPRSGA